MNSRVTTLLVMVISWHGVAKADSVAFFESSKKARVILNNGNTADADFLWDILSIEPATSGLKQSKAFESSHGEFKVVCNRANTTPKPVTSCTIGFAEVALASDCRRKNDKIYMRGKSSQFWSEIAALDPLAQLKTLGCKVFAIHGTSDWVVSSTNDGGAISRALVGDANFSSTILDGLDHFLLKMDSKKASVGLFMGGLKDENIKIHPEFIPTVTAVLEKWTSAN